MAKPHESWRELVDDLQLVYGEIVGQTTSGQPINGAELVERLGKIVTKAHREPTNHAKNVERAREAQRPMPRPDLQRTIRAVK